MAWSRVVAAGALALALGAQARAQGSGKGGGIEDPARVGQPGGAQAGGAPRGRELTGKVVKADDTTVYVEHMGAVVPLTVDRETRFSGEGVKRTGDLREGQEVRASFTVKGTANVADRITVERGTGRPTEAGRGTPTPSGGPEGMPGRGPIPPDRSPVPRDPGTPPPTDPGGPSRPGGPSLPKY